MTAGFGSALARAVAHRGKMTPGQNNRAWMMEAKHLVLLNDDTASDGFNGLAQLQPEIEKPSEQHQLVFAVVYGFGYLVLVMPRSGLVQFKGHFA
jgi:hypothetical protein